MSLIRQVLGTYKLSYVWLIHDHDGDYVCRWYRVSVESDDDMIQTIEVTLNQDQWDEVCKDHPHLKDVTIRNFNNQTNKMMD
jgi:hypothetical protein